MRAFIRMPAMVVWLTGLWMLLWADLSIANLLGGLAVASFVVLVTRVDRGSLRPTYFRPQWAVVYIFVFLWNLFVSNLKLAWEILTPTLHTHTAILAVEMRGGSEAVVNMVANSITLTPGTMTVDIHTEGDIDGDGSEDGVILYIHGMYTKDVEAVRRDVLRLEELALRAFGTPSDYQRARKALVDHDTRLRELRAQQEDGEPRPPKREEGDS